MKASDSGAGFNGYHVGFFSYAVRLFWFVLFRLVPAHALTLLSIMGPVAIAFWLADGRLEGGWSAVPPLGVLVFGGLGLVVARTTWRDLLAQRLIVRDILHRDSRKRSDSARPALGAVNGKVAAVGEPVIAPLSGTECVAYEYVIGFQSHEDSASGFEAGVLGYRLTACDVIGRDGAYRLAAFPDLHHFESATVRRTLARQHVENLDARPGIPIIDNWYVNRWLRRQEVEEVAIDLHLKAIESWAETSLEERALPNESRACVIGLIDHSRHRILPTGRLAGRRVLVYPGSARNVLRELKEDSRFGTGVAGVCLGLGAGALLSPLSLGIAALGAAIPIVLAAFVRGWIARSD